jgi:hypothetical protein
MLKEPSKYFHPIWEGAKVAGTSGDQLAWAMLDMKIIQKLLIIARDDHQSKSKDVFHFLYIYVGFELNRNWGKRKETKKAKVREHLIFEANDLLFRNLKDGTIPNHTSHSSIEVLSLRLSG